MDQTDEDDREETVQVRRAKTGVHNMWSDQGV